MIWFSKNLRYLKLLKIKRSQINYVRNGIRWNQNEVNIDDVFAYNIVLNIINDIEDQEPNFISDC